MEHAALKNIDDSKVLSQSGSFVTYRQYFSLQGENASQSPFAALTLRLKISVSCIVLFILSLK